MGVLQLHDRRQALLKRIARAEEAIRNAHAELAHMEREAVEEKRRSGEMLDSGMTFCTLPMPSHRPTMPR